MTKLRVFESISVDGYFCDDAGDMSWAHGAPDREYDAWVAGNASGGGALVLGRKTYQMMEGFWTTPMAAQLMPEVARGMNAMTKYVATRTLTPTWHGSVRLDGELVDAVRALKAGDGPGLTVLGSGEVAAALGQAGLVDEYQLVIVPVALGGGRTVFTGRRPLRLLDQRAFANGRVVVTYAVA